jgi:hypothetical protein
VLTLTASTALFFTLIQVLLLRLGVYLLNISTTNPPLTLTDLVAYSGYQYVRCAVIYGSFNSFLFQSDFHSNNHIVSTVRVDPFWYSGLHLLCPWMVSGRLYWVVFVAFLFNHIAHVLTDSCVL